jgi:hypothetical protein
VQIQTFSSTLASCVAGGVAGAIARGRRNVLPGAFVFGVLGFTGEKVRPKVEAWVEDYQNSSARDGSEGQGGVLKWLGERKWTPFRMLNDDEYAGRLSEKLLKIDAEILLIEEEVQRLRSEDSARK